MTNQATAAPVPSLAAFEDLFQHQRLVVFLIPRAVHQGHGVFCALLLQQFDGALLLAEFLPVPDLELLPFGGIVTEPLAQLRARGHVLQPQFHRRALFGQTARPQAINQDSQAVFSRRLFVNPLHLNHRRDTPLCGVAHSSTSASKPAAWSASINAAALKSPLASQHGWQQLWMPVSLRLLTLPAGTLLSTLVSFNFGFRMFFLSSQRGTGD